jgi:hypothetical protein
MAGSWSHRGSLGSISSAFQAEVLTMVLADAMTGADWRAWIGYELVIAVVIFAKTVFWFRRTVREVRAALASWVGLLLLAFFAAIGLSQWRETDYFAALVAFGLASGMIVSAAVNAAYKLGSGRGHEGCCS